jgi:hypothetical protein
VKKFATWLLMLTLPLLLGCEKRLFNFVTTIDLTSLFSVSSANGHFSEEYTITQVDVVGKLNIPLKAHVTDVEVESIFLRVTVRPQNQAQAVMFDGLFREYEDVVGWSADHPLFTGQTVDLEGVKKPFNAPVTEQSTANLKDLLSSYILGGRDVLKETMFSVQGESVPAGQQVSLDFQLVVRGTVKYEECVDTIPGTGGEKCNESTTPTSL